MVLFCVYLIISCFIHLFWRRLVLCIMSRRRVWVLSSSWWTGCLPQAWLESPGGHWIWVQCSRDSCPLAQGPKRETSTPRCDNQRCICQQTVFIQGTSLVLLRKCRGAPTSWDMRKKLWVTTIRSILTSFTTVWFGTTSANFHASSLLQKKILAAICSTDALPHLVLHTALISLRNKTIWQLNLFTLRALFLCTGAILKTIKPLGEGGSRTLLHWYAFLG